MEIQLSTSELLDLCQAENITPQLPKEVEDFFAEYFNFAEWKRKIDFDYYFCKIKCIHTSGINYQESIIYFENEQSKQNWLAVLAWIIQTLQNENTNLKYQQMAFELSSIAPHFWKISYEKGIVFSQSCKTLALDYLTAISMNVRNDKNAQTYDKEAIEQLKFTLENRNWQSIGEQYWSIESVYNILYLNFHSTYSFLIWFHFNETVKLINEENQAWKLLWLLVHLPESKIISYMLATTNQLACFLLLYRLCHKEILVSELLNITTIWQRLTPELLNQWLHIFNEYPNRYPALQIGLGKFLATADNEQIKTYIDSLQLSSKYQDIQECLTYFLENSDSSKVKYFCELAYQKWENWSPKYYNHELSCALDLVIVMHFKDYQTQDQRDEFIQKHLNDILSIHYRWYTSQTDLDKYVHFHLFKIQPVCIANELTKDSSLDFLSMNNKIFKPTFFSDDLLIRLDINTPRF